MPPATAIMQPSEIRLSGERVTTMVRVCIALISAIFATCTQAYSQQAPLAVNATNIDPRSQEHVEASYRQISDNAQKIFSRELVSRDYYTGLRIKANINAPLITRNCQTRTGAGWYYVVTATITYFGKTGRPPTVVNPGFPILTAARNYSVRDSRLLPGCTLKIVQDKPAAYILNDNFGEGAGEYEITLEPLFGFSSSPDVFQKVASLALTVVQGWGSIKAPQAAAITEVAKDLDFLRGSEVRSDLQMRTKIIPEGAARDDAGIKSGQRISVSFPWAINPQGNRQDDVRYMAFYSRRSASIVLDWANGANPNKLVEVNAAQVAFNTLLGAKHDCLLGADGCKEGYFSDSLVKKEPLQITGEWSDAEKASKLWSDLHIYCKDIRDTAEKLSLATVDRLLVRWAILTRAGFIDDSRVFVGEGPSYRSIVENLKIAGSGLGGQCWTTKDKAMLEAIESASNKKFVP